MKSANKKVLNTVLLIIVLSAFFPVVVQAYFDPGGGGGGSPPSPPVLNSIATPTDNVYLSWNSVATATSYKIYRCNTQSGTYSYIATTTNRYYTDYPSERGDWWYMVKARNSYGNSGYSNKRSVFFTDGVKKIAVFFWASDCLVDSIATSKYTDVLIDEGYSKFFYFKDTINFEADFASVDTYELSGDTIFFYLCGHGNFDDYNSYCILKPEGDFLYDYEFRILMDDLETTKKGFLIESCYSGGFVDYFGVYPYVAISSASKDWPSSAWGLTNGDLPGEGMFSNRFWYKVANGANYLEAFNYAYDLDNEGSDEYYVTFEPEDIENHVYHRQYPQIDYAIGCYNFFLY